MSKKRNRARNLPRESLPSEHPSSYWPKELSHQHALFVDLFLASFNGTQSAIGAGYSRKGADVQACRLLRNASIRAEIKRRRHLESERIGKAGRERLEREVACGAFANIANYGPLFGEGTLAEKLALLTRDQAAAVQEIVVEEFSDASSAARQVRRIKLKLVPKVTCLKLLAEANGWLLENVEVDHKHLILAVMLKEISDEQEGKPIVEDAVQIFSDKSSGGIP